MPKIKLQARNWPCNCLRKTAYLPASDSSMSSVLAKTRFPICSSNSNFHLSPHEGTPVTIFGDGKQTRDFIHISDVCNAIYEAAISKTSKSEILNLGTGKSVSILDLAKLISEIVSEEGGPEIPR